MTEKRKRGRPKASDKKAYTIRLDARLADVLDFYTRVIQEAEPSTVLNDLYQGIIERFFFDMDAKNGRYIPRDNGAIVDDLAERALYAELYEAERWAFFRDLERDAIPAMAARAISQKRELDAKARARVEAVEALRKQWRERDYLQAILELQERIHALEKAEQ